MTEQRSDLAVGIDFGGTKVLGAVVDKTGEVVAQHRVPTPYDGEELLDAIASVTHTLEDQINTKVAGVGVGAAGLVDRQGTLHYGPNVGGVTEVQVQEGMQKRLGDQYVVRVDNDANVATWGECLFGAGKRVKEMVMVTLGTGIGGGLVTSGRLFRGQNGFAAEFGHITLMANGMLCACGKHGCWESYASGRALGRLGRDAAAATAFERGIELAGDVESIRGEHVTKAARMGDHAALAVLDEFSFWLAAGMASVVSMIDPEVIVIGGGLAEESDLYLDLAREKFQAMLFGGDNRPRVRIERATLGERAGVVGAAMLVHGDAIPEY